MKQWHNFASTRFCENFAEDLTVDRTRPVINDA